MPGILMLVTNWHLFQFFWQVKDTTETYKGKCLRVLETITSYEYFSGLTYYAITIADCTGLPSNCAMIGERSNLKRLVGSGRDLCDLLSQHRHKGLDKTVKTLTQYKWCSSQDPNWAPTEYTSTAILLNQHACSQRNTNTFFLFLSFFLSFFLGIFSTYTL
jgi:hypothetical protein